MNELKVPGFNQFNNFLLLLEVFFLSKGFSVKLLRDNLDPKRHNRNKGY